MNMKSSSSFFTIQKDSILLPKDAKNTESLPLHKNRLMYIYLCKSASSLFLKGAIRSVCVTRVQTTSKIFISLKERKAHRVLDKESHTFVCLQRVLWRHLIKKKERKGRKKDDRRGRACPSWCVVSSGFLILSFNGHVASLTRIGRVNRPGCWSSLTTNQLLEEEIHLKNDAREIVIVPSLKCRWTASKEIDGSTYQKFRRDSLARMPKEMKPKTIM